MLQKRGTEKIHRLKKYEMRIYAAKEKEVSKTYPKQTKKHPKPGKQKRQKWKISNATEAAHDQIFMEDNKFYLRATEKKFSAQKALYARNECERTISPACVGALGCSCCLLSNASLDHKIKLCGMRRSAMEKNVIIPMCFIFV